MFDVVGVRDEIIVVNDIKDFGFSYYRPFEPYGKYKSISQFFPDFVNPCKVNLINTRLVVFTGGCDVDPKLYGEKKEPRTYCSEKRDNFELIIFKKAREKNIPCFGICRGAQFLCAMAGGKLVQHVENHNGMHELITNDGRKFTTNSSHHQVQIPPSTANILAWANSPNGIDEPEAVEYPTINAIGVQYHPEVMLENDDTFLYTRELIEKLLKYSDKS